MELDKRILPGKRPLTCFDTEEAKQFIGQEGYFSNKKVHFKDLNNACRDVLQDVFDSYDNTPPVKHSNDFCQNLNETYCFVSSVSGYKYFLPAKWVKPEKPEIKWRPFTLDEFIDRFDLEVGTRVFLIRDKTTPVNQRRLLLTGIIQDKDPYSCGVCLGGFYFTFPDLFNMFEVRFGKNDWQPFGVEEASE